MDKINEKYQELRFNEWLDFLVEKESKGQWVRTLIGLGVLVKDEKTGKLKKTGKKVSKEEIKAAMKANKGGKEKNDAEQSGKKEKDGKKKWEPKKFEKDAAGTDISLTKGKRRQAKVAKNTMKKSLDFAETMEDELAMSGSDEDIKDLKKTMKNVKKAMSGMKAIEKEKKGALGKHFYRLQGNMDKAADDIHKLANKVANNPNDYDPSTVQLAKKMRAAAKSLRKVKKKMFEEGEEQQYDSWKIEKLVIEMTTHLVNIDLLMEEFLQEKKKGR